MRATLIAIVLASVGGAVCAQPADEGSKELRTCFQSTRAADAVCSDPRNGAVERLDCRQKALMAQLECLEQVFPGGSTGSVTPEIPPRTVSREMTTGTASPRVPARSVDNPPKPPDTNWLVNETTSPVDFTPLITAMTRLPSSVKHAPNTLAIRCRGGRTELLVRTGGTRRVSSAREVRVDYQINDQPPVRLVWAASADGKTAIYKDDPVGLLQALPEGARLKINVLDGADAGHEATFPLAGLDAVRDKIAAACKWTPPANKMPSEKR